jgi:hypothetical protein
MKRFSEERNTMSRKANAERWLRRLDDITKQHVHPGERDHHQVQVREAKEDALRDMYASLNGADADELAVINAAIAKITGKEEAKPATVSKTRKRND